MDKSWDALFALPFCDHCATLYDPEYFDPIEDKAHCPNCARSYTVDDKHKPSQNEEDTATSAAPDTAPLVEFRQQLEAAAAEANRGCGLVYELYEERLFAACDSLLDRLPDEHRAAALAIAKQKHGYTPEWEPFTPEPGTCDLTGIDPYCCPCGRHP